MKTDPALWFTLRERQVMALLCQARQNKEIAQELDISVHAVKYHISALLGKLDLDGRFELLLWCLQHAEALEKGYTHDRRLHGSTCRCGSCPELRSPRAA